MQLTAQMRLLVAVQPADFRCGIDGLGRICRRVFDADPMSGAVFVFRNRSATAVKILAYDGQGFWLCQKRLSQGKFKYWPKSADSTSVALLVHELQVLLAGGDPQHTVAAPQWRPVTPLRAVA